MTHRPARILICTAALLAGLVSPTLADEPKDALEAAFDVVVQQKLKPAEDKAADAKTEAEDGAEKEGKPDADEKAEDAGPTEAELRQRMNELERELREARDAFQKRAQKDRTEIEEQQRKRVDQINLPEKPTREQCEQFIAELREAAKNKRSFSSADPIVDKLKQIPEDYYDLLMTETANRTTLRYFANYAMRDIDPEVMRERFIATLKDNPNNIGVIVTNGWCQDVRDQVIEQIKSADGTITPGWFQAAVEVAEPELYPKLHEVTINSTRYASQFLQMLQALPDYDLANTVNACWVRSSEGKLQTSQSSFAMMAAEIGNVEALGVLIAQLRTSTTFHTSSSTYNIRRTNAMRFIDYRGSNLEMQQWYNKHKNDLVFDHLRKRFVLPDDQ